MVDILSIAGDLTIDDIPEQIRCVAVNCSIQAAATLMVHCPGIDIYVPTAGKKLLDKLYIQEHYNGSNASSISVRLGRDRAWVLKAAKEVAASPIPSDFEMPNECMALISERCGREVAIELMRAFQSTTIYIPLDSVYRLKRAYISRHFNGGNAASLAADLAVSERYVRSVVADNYHSNAIQLKLDLGDVRKTAM